MSTNRLLVTTLALCAVTDFVTAPIPVDGHGHPPAGIIVAVYVLGAVTAFAAYAIARGRRVGRPLAWGTRGIDLVVSLPAFAGGAVPALAASAAVGLSLLAIALLIRTRTLASTAIS